MPTHSHTPQLAINWKDFSTLIMPFQLGFSVEEESQSLSASQPREKRGFNQTDRGRQTLHTTMTDEGIDIMELLKHQKTVINQIDMRLRFVENTAFITLKTVPDHKWVVNGMNGGKTHNRLVVKAKEDGITAKERKKIGSPNLYVAYEWIKLIFEIASNEQTAILKDKVQILTELGIIEKKATDVHYMEYVFSHSQCWINKDKTQGYLKFKFTPWFQNTELWITDMLLSDSRTTLEGQPAAWGPKVYEMNKALGLDGRGRKND